MLAGLSVSVFGPAAQAAFSAAMAASLNVDIAAVTVTSVTDVSRRRLMAAGAAVAFTVSVSSASAATGVASGITAVSNDSSAFVSALNSNLAAAGLPPCTGVAVSAPVVAAPPALNLSGLDVSAAVDAVASSFDNLSAEAASEKQSQMLNSLLMGTENANFTLEGASTLAAMVLAVVSAPPGVVLSVASQTAALDILSAVSNAKIDATSGVGQTIASALDSVASSAVSGGNPAALAAVLNVINNLAAGQAASLLENMDMTPGAPPPKPATTNTPSIQTLVQVDPPGSDRLTTQPLTAPGSASAFEPMPAGLLPSATPVVTQFFSLAFDPNGGSTSGGAESNSGVTRLAFTNPDGSPVPVENAAKPILFALPRVSLDAESQAMCTYWDATAKSYLTDGCTGVPDPQPPGHTLAFIPGYETPDDASLAMAWNISGPLMAGCTSAAQQPSFRVFSGSACKLLQPNNTFNCAWSNVMQAFQGTGCVYSPADVAQCMCRHVRAPLPLAFSTRFALVCAPWLTCAQSLAPLRSSPTSPSWPYLSWRSRLHQLC
jgi:hypothetical protein